jgi:TPR repeat protein
MGIMRAMGIGMGVALLLSSTLARAADAPSTRPSSEPSTRAGSTRAEIQLLIKAGLEAQRRGEFGDLQIAIQRFTEAADLGSPEAAYYLGTMYASGSGVPKQPAIAFEHFRKSAAGKYLPGMRELAAAYLAGDGVAKNEAEAARWYRAAADAGDAPSAKQLAIMLKSGQCVKPDNHEALTYFLKAASNGDNEAGWAAAQMYQKGEGIFHPDPERALAWYERIAAHGHVPGQVQLAALAPIRYRKIAKSYTISELTRDEKWLNYPVMLEGKLVDMGEKTCRLAGPLKGKIAWGFKVDIGAIKEPTLRKDMAVRVYGPLVRSPPGLAIQALVAELVPPEFEWHYKLVKPKGVSGGSDQSFTVEGSVTNTGPQMIKSLDAAVRMYQISSPNDGSTKLTIENLGPGQTQEFSVTFTMHNYQMIGATSIPKVSVEVTDYQY